MTATYGRAVPDPAANMLGDLPADGRCEIRSH
jgi:hypothetical protein